MDYLSKEDILCLNRLWNSNNEIWEIKRKIFHMELTGKTFSNKYAFEKERLEWWKNNSKELLDSLTSDFEKTTTLIKYLDYEFKAIVFPSNFFMLQMRFDLSYDVFFYLRLRNELVGKCLMQKDECLKYLENSIGEESAKLYILSFMQKNIMTDILKIAFRILQNGTGSKADRKSLVVMLNYIAFLVPSLDEYLENNKFVVEEHPYLDTALYMSLENINGHDQDLIRYFASSAFMEYIIKEMFRETDKVLNNSAGKYLIKIYLAMLRASYVMISQKDMDKITREICMILGTKENENNQKIKEEILISLTFVEEDKEIPISLTLGRKKWN